MPSAGSGVAALVNAVRHRLERSARTAGRSAARAAGRQAAALRANQHDGLILPPLRAPLRRGLACVTMYAGPHCCRFAFFLDVVAAISDEGPGMAVAHHVGRKVAAIGAANRDGAAVAIEGPGFAGNMAVAYEGPQVFGGSPSSGPSVSAPLGRRRRVPPPKATGPATDLERISVHHTAGT